MLKSKEKKKDDRLCSFCGKNAGEVRKLVAGPCVFICDECVVLCGSIITDSDNSFLLEVIKASRETKHWRKKAMRTIEAPDEFWDLMDEVHIYEKMAAAILTESIEWNDSLYERAYNLTKKSRNANRLAWKIIFDSDASLDGKQMSASHGTRKIHIYD